MSTPASADTIFSIGYGARSIEQYIELLMQYDIAFLIDTRSQPHSRWKPEFSRKPLSRAVEAAGIRYLFLGDRIGGRPTDETCYPNGRVEGRPDYNLVRAKPWFIEGIERLEDGLRQGHRIAIMCAEQKPEVCHRTHLIGEALQQRGTSIVHIDEHGKLRSHETIMHRATGGQQKLF